MERAQAFPHIFKAQMTGFKVTNDGSLPIPFHWWELVKWPQLDTKDPGRCSSWLRSHLAATTSHYGIGRADCGRQTDISDSQCFGYFFHEKKENFLLSPGNCLRLRWHGNLSSFFWGFLWVFTLSFTEEEFTNKIIYIYIYIYIYSVQCDGLIYIYFVKGFK